MKNTVDSQKHTVSETFSMFEATGSEYSLSVVEGANVRNNPSKHTILFHGWGNKEVDLENWKNKLLAEGIDGYVWTTQYDTGKSFNDAGLWFYDEFKRREQEGYIFEDVRLLCYSMGGLVGRRLISLGFKVNLLVSVCSPHEGLRDNIPAINDGVKSLKVNSRELNAMTNNQIDIENRKNFVFTGFTYSCEGNHTSYEDDTVVNLYSAVGDNLGSLKNRHAIKWSYPNTNGPIWFTDERAPHQLPLKNEYTSSAIGYLINLFR